MILLALVIHFEQVVYLCLEKFPLQISSILQWLTTRFAQLISRVIGRVRIVDIVLRSLPVLGDHLIQQVRLLGINEHVLPQTPLPSCRFLPHMLMPASLRTDPSTPVESLEAFQNSLHGLSLTFLQGEFNNRAGRLMLLGRRNTFRRVQNVRIFLETAAGGNGKWSTLAGSITDLQEGGKVSR